MMALRPIIVDSEGMILGGNMRFKALKELGYKDVPDEWVKRDSELTDAEKQRFIIADNIGFGEYDWDVLANEWDKDDLIEWGLEIPDFAFKQEAVEDDYEIPDEIETDIVLGDLFEIGQHRLLCGDSTDSDQVAKLMNGQKADMVFTDPPYGMSLDVSNSDNVGAKDGWKSKPKNYSKVIGDGKDFTPELINTVFACFDYCQEIFIWGADYFAELIPNRKTGSWIVWDKRAGIEDLKLTFSEFELCWSKTPHKKEVIHFNWFRYFGLSSQDIKKREHPTQKPLQVINPYIEKYSKHLIADLYLGSGSTMVAGHQLKRKVYGMELDPKYCQVIIDRMRNMDKELKIFKNGVPWQEKTKTGKEQ